MAGSSVFRGGFWLLAIGFVVVAGIALAERTAPTERKGISTVELKSIALGPEIPGMEGRHLRVRRGTLEPGGHNAVHTHADRPEILYVVEGAITEHRNAATTDYHTGDILEGTKETKHWIENKGASKATFLVVDIVKK